ncbi:MAG: hypothetical protein QNJ54_35000 [Prochloraceae cyanobacterium]|nr:hypothetical protein [Prochloraceae cyanobacterium]
MSYLNSGEVKAWLAVRRKHEKGCDLFPIEMWNNLAIKALEDTCAGSTIAI